MSVLYHTSAPLTSPGFVNFSDSGRRKKEERKAAALRSSFFCGILIPALPMNGKRLVPCFVGGASCPLIPRKGGLPMVTYSDLIQTGILVVAIIALFLQANNKK